MAAAGRAQLLQMLFCREADKTSRVEGKHNQEPLVLTIRKSWVPLRA